MWNKLATLTKRASVRPKANSKAPIASGPGNRTETINSGSEDAIRLRAYQKWEAAGKPEGNGLRFWLEATQEILHGN
jgi:hypothetical protein